MKIIPLSKKYLEQANKLSLKCFPWVKPDFDDYPPRSFEASLDPSKINLLKGVKEINSKYYILIEKDKVIGITGLYSDKIDIKDAYWMGWTCVDPKYQKKGLGIRLINYIIKKAKKNKRYLRVYLNKDLTEFYNKFNFKKVGKEKKVNKWYTRVDMELEL